MVEMVKESTPILNKRAQRALDCSSEKLVKGHSGAIYRGPLMLYTNNKAQVDFYKIFKIS